MCPQADRATAERPSSPAPPSGHPVPGRREQGVLLPTGVGSQAPLPSQWERGWGEGRSPHDRLLDASGGRRAP